MIPGVSNKATYVSQSTATESPKPTIHSEFATAEEIDALQKLLPTDATMAEIVDMKTGLDYLNKTLNDFSAGVQGDDAGQKMDSGELDFWQLAVARFVGTYNERASSSDAQAERALRNPPPN